jgi:S1-C subfamily serine protease
MSVFPSQHRRRCRAALAALLAATSRAPAGPATDDLIDEALSAEAARIALIERTAPAVVAIFDEAEMGGGSGVLIDEAGYGLTNFHVVAEMMESRRGRGGLPDGKLYDLEVLGLDPGGDVAMFRLVGDKPFPYAPLGDATQVHVGDRVLAMGNPFVLSEDYTPTVTFGIVSGVNRYQYGAGEEGALLYSDCLQVDASINPGNSGGPLFDLAGRIIGINGRISVSMRGRVNVGLGYAITTNQIRMFAPGLRAGLLTAHGTLQAIARDAHDGSVRLIELLEDGPAWNLGARPGDVLVRLDDRPITSANAFASIMGTLPADWPVVLRYRDADGFEHHGIVRTEPIRLREIEEKFTPDPTINLDAVERAVRRFRAPLNFPNSPDAAAASVLGQRFELAESDGPAAPYRIASFGDELQLASEDVAGRGITVSAEAAGTSDPLGTQPLPQRNSLAWRGLWAACRAAATAEREALSSWRHRGADRLLEIDDQGAIVRDEILESVEVPLGRAALALLQFNDDTGRLRRIRTLDTLTGDEVEILLLEKANPPQLLARTAHGELFTLTPQDAAWAKPDDASDSPAVTPPLDRAALAPLAEHVQARVVKLIGASIGRAAGYGSGILISSNGLVLTVDSGLLDATHARAILPDGAIRGIDIVRADRGKQLALLRLRAPEGAEPADYPFFDLSVDATVSPGARVLAAGNPFKVASGAEPVSIAQGVYCGTTRLDATRGTQEFPYHGEVLLIDAITSTPGFAGGALTDATGRLLGLIGRAVEARTTFTNLNYAVPRSVLAEFVAAALGETPLGDPLTDSAAAAIYHGIKFFELGYRSNPVYVERVRRGSPAARAGLRKDDLIIGANNTQITSLAVMQRVLDGLRPNDTLDLTILRGDEVKRISVILEAAP